jgi:hypothetical protein
MPDNGFAEGIVLRVGTFFRVKPYDLQSGDDGSFALFSFWKRHF